VQVVTFPCADVARKNVQREAKALPLLIRSELLSAPESRPSLRASDSVNL
jgi:hypothetical protein